MDFHILFNVMAYTKIKYANPSGGVLRYEDADPTFFPSNFP